MQTLHQEKRSAVRIYLCFIPALLLIGAATDVAFAQQWATNQNDINNTNSGNVRVGGGAAPTAVLHVRGNLSWQIGGTVSVVQNSTAVTGTGTSFTSEFNAGDSIKIGSEIFTVSSVGSNTSLTLDSNYLGASASSVNAYRDPNLFALDNGDSGNHLTITRRGFVGLGITAPTAKLDVVGSGAAPIRAVRDNATTDSAAASAATIQLHNPNTTANNFVGIALQTLDTAGNVKPSSFIKSIITARTTSGVSGELAFSVNNGASIVEAMRLTSASNVGIGTTTPSNRFEVVGPGQWVAKFRRTDTSNGGIMIDSPAGFAANLGLAANGVVKWYLLSNPANSDKLQFWESSGTQARFTFTQGGTLGIGTENPSASYKLDVAGSLNASSGLCIAGDCKTSWSQVGSNQWGTGAGNSINYSSGNVGIGTSSPQTLLNLHATSNPILQLTNGTSGTTATDGLQIVHDGLTTYLDNREAGSLVMRTAATDRMLINSSGNVGIATPSPTEKLHVTGNVKIEGNIDVTGNIKAKYQDLAEWVESSQDLAAGTVVVLDRSKSNQVIASTQAYDSRVAGVISLRPGLMLGEEGEGRVLVATTGRVKVKVDATNGPIEIGDLLVTSDREGFAMKSLPVDLSGVRFHRPGTLIGKALEPLASGTGEILVLLSMQ